MNLATPRPNAKARPAALLLLAAALAAPGAPRAAELATVDADLELRSPRPGVPLAEPRPRFEIALPARRGEALLSLDGVDVTGLARREGDLLTFEPAAPLAAGPHELTLAVSDPEGVTRRTWKVAVAPAARPGVRAFAEGGLSGSGQAAFASQGRAKDLSGSATLALTAGVEVGAWEASVAGHGGWYPEGPGPRLTAGGFLWTLRRGPDSLVLGDVSVTGTPYLAPSLARRGLLLTLDHLGATAQAFQVATQPVRGNDLGVDLRDRSDQLQGGSLRAPLPGGFQLQATYAQGRQSSGASFATSSIDGPSEGRAAGVAISGTALGVSVAAEGAWSSHDADTRDAAGAVSDKAGGLRLGAPVGPVALSAQYEWIGPAFSSMANPGATRDRQQGGLSASTTLGPVSLSASGGRGADNVGGDRTRPVVVNTSAGATAGLAAGGWPSLTVSWVRGLLGAERVPAGAPAVDSTTDTATAALAYARGGYTGSLTATRSWLDDRVAGKGTTATGLTVGASARPVGDLTIAPTFSRNVSDGGGVTRTSDLAALSVSASLWPKVLTLAGQGSWARVTASDGSSASEQTSGVLRIGWELHRLLGRLAELGTAVLGASGRFSRVEQGGPTPSATTSWGAFVTLDVHLPIALGRGGGRGAARVGGSPAAEAAAEPLTGAPPRRVAGTATAGPLQPRRLDLAFRDGRAEALRPRGGELRARATLRYAGLGALQARWVVDGRPAEDVALALTEGDTLVVETAASLPTFEPGRHVVTLELLLPAPPPGWRAPELTYVVTAAEAPSAPGGRP